MIFLLAFFVCVIYIIFLNNFYLSKKFLLDKPLEVDHKSPSSKNLPQIGGIYLFTTFLTVTFFTVSCIFFYRASAADLTVFAAKKKFTFFLQSTG